MSMQKGGSNREAIQEQSQARIQLSRPHEYFPGTSDRLLLVSGTLSNAIRALNLIITILHEANCSRSGSESDEGVGEFGEYGAGGAGGPSGASPSQEAVELGPGGQTRQQNLQAELEAFRQRLAAMNMAGGPSSYESQQLQSLHQELQQTAVLQQLQQGQQVGPSSEVSVAGAAHQALLQRPRRSSQTQIRLLIPAALCGIVLGPGGVTLRTISAETGTNISLSPQNLHRNLDYERIATITGPKSSALRAVVLVTNKMMSAPQAETFFKRAMQISPITASRVASAPLADVAGTAPMSGPAGSQDTRSFVHSAGNYPPAHALSSPVLQSSVAGLLSVSNQGVYGQGQTGTPAMSQVGSAGSGSTVTVSATQGLVTASGSLTPSASVLNLPAVPVQTTQMARLSQGISSGLQLSSGITLTGPNIQAVQSNISIQQIGTIQSGASGGQGASVAGMPVALQSIVVPGSSQAVQIPRMQQRQYVNLSGSGNVLISQATFEANIAVPEEGLGAILGRDGSELQAITQFTQALVVVGDRNLTDATTGTRNVCIRGDQDSIYQVYQNILSRVSEALIRKRGQPWNPPPLIYTLVD